MNYNQLTQIGAGGCGVVYLVPQHALKVLKGTTAEAKSNFQYEAEIAEHLSNNADATQYVPEFLAYYNEHDELHMEYLEGYEPVEMLGFAEPDERPGRTAPGRKRPKEEVLIKLLDRLLEALAALEVAGVSHGDVSTGNILYRRADDGNLELKMIDFGYSMTEPDAEERGWWLAMRNLNVQAAADVVVCLATGDYFQPALFLKHYSKWFTSFVQQMSQFGDISEAYFTGSGGDDTLLTMTTGGNAEWTAQETLTKWKEHCESGRPQTRAWTSSRNQRQ
jgi:serine/threonine protein kinase